MARTHAPAKSFIGISEAAAMLGRRPDTLRKWSQRRPPRLRAYRDGITKTRFFARADVEALLPKPEADRG